MRKLATVREVSQVLPIPDADRIEVAVVDGWKCVVKKGEFQVHERVVYCEIDSFLPIRPEFEFLRNTSYRKMGEQEGFRLKTVKLRGQISQGLLLPLSVLDASKEWALGDDVTEQLRIIQYEDELPDTTMAPFPTGVPKTDADRIQNKTNSYDELRQLTFYVTEKLDGTSCTLFWDGQHAGICSRNYEQIAGDSPQRQWFQANPAIVDKLQSMGKNYAIQGELIGNKIARNTYKMENVELYIFSVFDRDAGEYLHHDEIKRAAEYLGLPTVPVLPEITRFPETVDEAIAMADGKSILSSKVDREGLVWIHGTGTDRLAIKTISNRYLVKEK